MESVAPRVIAVQWLPLCIQQLGLQGLACLAACSKQLRRDYSDLLQNDAAEALLGALQAAGAAKAAICDVGSTAAEMRSTALSTGSVGCLNRFRRNSTQSCWL
jgi:hypothetical protein